MDNLPQQFRYQPTQQFQMALKQLDAGLVEAGQRGQKPISTNAALNEVMLPLFNLMANYLKVAQSDTFGYFFGLFGYLYQQQQQSANDNIILAVDPDLAEEIAGVSEAARDTINKTKSFIRRIQEYLGANKPHDEFSVVGMSEEMTEDEIKKSKEKHEANVELWHSLREEALRVVSALNESHEDLGVMADNVDAATYEPDEDVDDEGEDGSEDEVALPGGGEDESDGDEPYESVVG